MTSRKLTLAALVVIGLTLCSIPAAAQSEIILGSSNGLLIFQGMGAGTSTLSLTLGSCKAGVCKLGGTAHGTGNLLSGPAPYVFLSTLGSITLSLVDKVAGLWNITQTSPIDFSYGKNGSLLTGTLDLLSLEKIPGGKGGLFNYLENANLMITGGSLASFFTADAILDVTIRFRTTEGLDTLLGTTKKVGAEIAHGEILATPEPSTGFLLGSGLLALGTMLRIRWRNNRSAKHA
jgi:hypothetical protein